MRRWCGLGCAGMSDDGVMFVFFFFNDTATTEIYTLSLHDALPISIAESLRTRFANVVPPRNLKFN